MNSQALTSLSIPRLFLVDSYSFLSTLTEALSSNSLWIATIPFCLARNRMNNPDMLNEDMKI